MFVRSELINLHIVIIALVAPMVLVGGQRQGACCQEYCYNMDPERPQSAHFGSKTSYLIAKGPETGKQYLVPNCSPVKMWVYSRHGTRLPEAEWIQRLSHLGGVRDEIIDNYEKRHSKPAIGAMCETDLDLLKRWSWDQNITTDHSEYLTDQGWQELKFLAIRYQRHFPNIFLNTYDPTSFLFRYTNTQRTEASFKAFVEGLFGPRAYERIHVQQPPINDTLLRAYDYCPALDAKTNQDGAESSKFLKSQTMTQLINDVSQRLGYRFPLKSEQVMDMFEMCRLDQAWMIDRPSPWCAAFTPTQIDDLEYLEDLKKYYKSGYGRPIASHVQCEAINDMLHHLESRDQPNAVVYFTHSKSILLLLTALKAVKDSEALRADNYYSMSRRKWRLSEISPFSSNLAAIKYDCPNEVEREKVMFFLNEKPLNFEWCKVGLCNWSDIKEQYKEFSRANCNEYFCGNSGQAIKSLAVTLLFAPLITIIIHMFAM